MYSRAFANPDVTDVVRLIGSHYRQYQYGYFVLTFGRKAIECSSTRADDKHMKYSILAMHEAYLRVIIQLTVKLHNPSPISQSASRITTD